MEYNNRETIIAYEEGLAEGLRQTLRLAELEISDFNWVEYLDSMYKAQLKNIAEVDHDGY